MCQLKRDYQMLWDNLWDYMRDRRIKLYDNYRTVEAYDLMDHQGVENQMQLLNELMDHMIAEEQKTRIVRLPGAYP